MYMKMQYLRISLDDYQRFFTTVHNTGLKPGLPSFK